MQKFKFRFLLLIIFISSILFVGCWNYREMDQLAIVAGAAIDKDEYGDISMLVEIVEFSNEKDSKISHKTISIKGATIFDTARNAISVSGKRLYWAHAKVIVISDQVAREGTIKIIDWINRDSETRSNINILIAKGNLAKEILQSGGNKSNIKSFEIARILKNQVSLSKAPRVESWELVNSIIGKGISAVAPTVQLKTINGEKSPSVMGTAIFSKDKLVGFLDDKETKDMLFIQDKVKGGVLVSRESENNKDIPVSLEIFDNKTKIKPILEDGNIRFNVNVNVNTAIDEIGGSADFIGENGSSKLEQSYERTMEIRIKKLITKIQKEYGVDIFGFGARLKEDKPKTWRAVEKNWQESFRTIHVDVKVNVYIRNSGILSKPLEEGD